MTVRGFQSDGVMLKPPGERQNKSAVIWDLRNKPANDCQFLFEAGACWVERIQLNKKD